MFGKITLFCWITFVICTAVLIYGTITASYEYEQKYGYAWELADKSSSLPEKAEYISTFVALLESNSNDFAEYDAVFRPTPNSSFANNLRAVRSLRDRLRTAATMNVSSMEYQLAIQQITGQEQGEAGQLTSTLSSCWILKNYSYLWGWKFGLYLFCLVILFVVSLFLTAGYFSY